MAKKTCSACTCNTKGSISCSKTDGTCHCYEGYSGVNCDTCSIGYILSNNDTCTIKECSSIDPCGVNKICHNDNECQNEHKCGTDNCPSFLGLESSADCCQKPNVIFSFYETSGSVSAGNYITFSKSFINSGNSFY